MECYFLSMKICMINDVVWQGVNFRDLKGIIIKVDGVIVDVVRELCEFLKLGKFLVCNLYICVVLGLMNFEFIVIFLM